MSTEQKWIDHPDNEAPEMVAERFGRSVEWANEHIGPHRCVDGRLYVSSCLVSDPTCDSGARYFIEKKPEA